MARGSEWRLQPRQLARAVRGACMSLVLGAASVATVGAHAGTADWWISLGVYASPSAAGKAAAGLGEQQDVAPRVLAFEREGRTLHRVAVGPYEAGQPLRTALQAWRREARGAFALQLDAGSTAPSSMAAGTRAAAVAPEATTPATADVAQARVATRPAAGVAPAPVALAPAETPAPAAVDSMAGLRLDPAMERLLRDDAALQRELERLSRGLPRGLGNEIEAAQAHGVSLREARARTMSGPASPAVAPPGYQLHHLRRDDVAPEGAPSDD